MTRKMRLVPIGVKPNGRSLFPRSRASMVVGSTLRSAIARDAWSLRGRGTRGFLGTRGNASVCSGSMKRFVTILAALALALVLLAPSDVQARQHASSARSSVGSTGSHVGHRHSDAFLGFMDKHGKNYCGETHPNACETSMLR